MPDKRKKITYAKFKERLVAVLGDKPERPFSEATGISISTVYRWCNGDVEVPQYAVVILEFLEVLPKGFRPERWVR